MTARLGTALAKHLAKEALALDRSLGDPSKASPGPATVAGQPTSQGTDMPRTVLQIYAAAVCFVSVACLAIALGIIAFSTVGVLFPSLTVHPMSTMPPPPMPPMPFLDGVRGTATEPALPPKPSPEEEAKRRAQAYENAIRLEVADSKRSLLRWGIAALISGLLFLAHWKLLLRESRRPG